MKSLTGKNEVLRTGSVRGQLEFPKVKEDFSGFIQGVQAASMMLAEVDEDPNQTPHFSKVDSANEAPHFTTEVNDPNTNPHYVEPPPRDINEPEVIMDLADFYDVQIFTTVSVGSNKQSFQCIFDTGSNWLWVTSRVC